jgi:outer membrane protein TolC
MVRIVSNVRAVLLAACLAPAIAQAQAQPQTATQPEHASQLQQQQQGQGHGQGQIQGQSQELTLREVLTQALAHAPQVATARAMVAAAHAQSRQASSRLWPTVGLSTQYGRSKDMDSTLGLDRTTNRGDAVLRWNLFNGLEDKRQIDAQRLARIAADAELLHALDEACERIGSAYFDLLRQQQLSQHAERRLTEVEALVRRVERQAELGKGSDADAQLAAASRIDARLTLQSVQANHRAAQARLRVLLGEPAERALRVADAPAPPVDLQQPLDTWLAQAQQQNGQWLAAAARMAEAQARISSIAPEYLPRVDVDLRRRLYDRTDPAPTTTQRRGWSVGMTLDVPLGGAPGARRDEARALAEAAESTLQGVRDTVQADLGVARQQALQADSAAPQLTSQRAHWESVVRASELQYDAGRRSLMQLIDQHDRRFGVQQRDVDNAWQRAITHLRLRRLGGDLAEWFGVAPS